MCGNTRRSRSSDADLERIAEAGWRAPSAKNRQPWDFIIVTDRAQLQELSTVWMGAGHIAAAAAAIVLVVPVPPDERRKLIDQYDVGQATMAMMLAATDLGIGTGHSSVGDQDKARAILGVPDDHLVAFMLGVGYPADRPLAADPQTESAAVRRSRPSWPLVIRYAAPNRGAESHPAGTSGRRPLPRLAMCHA